MEIFSKTQSQFTFPVDGTIERDGSKKRTETQDYKELSMAQLFRQSKPNVNINGCNRVKKNELAEHSKRIPKILMLNFVKNIPVFIWFAVPYSSRDLIYAELFYNFSTSLLL